MEVVAMKNYPWEVQLAERDNDPDGDKFIWTQMPFCSNDLFALKNDYPFLGSLFSEKAFLRQKNISQLQSLIPPIKKGSTQQGKAYSFPHFPHTRYDHAKMVGMMAMYLIYKCNLSWPEETSFVIAAAYHDSATVARGDAIRNAFEELCEERNFSEYIQSYNLENKWNILGFNLAKAQKYVLGRGKFGRVVNIIDRISYTLLDCFYLGENIPSELKTFIANNPLFGDVWLDIHITHNQVYFSHAKRLWIFLMIRALMHVHLYKNPDCRKFEHVIAKETKKMLAEGIITFDDLKKKDDNWLTSKIEKYNQKMTSLMHPELIDWKYFSNEHDCLQYASSLGEKLILTENIKNFDSCLDWNIGNKGLKLHSTISIEESQQLCKLSSLRSGWYAYFYK
jgi:hypothetical protein